MLSKDAENEVTNELGYKFGVTEEKAFLTGDGSGKPLGVFTASASGISTARDVTASAPPRSPPTT
jgi:HK97 family phage major capsid protein